MSLQQRARVPARFVERHAVRTGDGSAAITVIDPATSAGMHFDALWVTGLDAERWPAPVNPDPLIPLELQRAAGIPEARPNGVMRQATTAATLDEQRARIMLSWPKHDGEVELAAQSDAGDRGRDRRRATVAVAGRRCVACCSSSVRCSNTCAMSARRRCHRANSARRRAHDRAAVALSVPRTGGDSFARRSVASASASASSRSIAARPASSVGRNLGVVADAGSTCSRSMKQTLAERVRECAAASRVAGAAADVRYRNDSPRWRSIASCGRLCGF